MARSVLIVDDHEAGRHAGLLEAEGFEVLGEAGDGESAVSGPAASVRRSFCSTSSSPGSMASRWPSSSPRSRRHRRSS